ncbi:hypothetical protein QR680_003677 [Steinernema hermaphroditum]|uniref:Protein kinase domain-containing protein n=1 Tax=Steinernema hermaphroditum TaxID=289476 RepID=A0AA39LSH0_9BILA|nr:hypothetical protein QR680_003677 [Steinernema hermaphroditum]
MEPPPQFRDLRIAGLYVVGRRIGSGSFGVVHRGENVKTEEEVAIKLECMTTVPSLLHKEFKFYRTMVCGVGIPQIKYYGQAVGYNVMVMDLLGQSLEDLFSLCGRRFSMKTVLMLADQMIERAEYIHSKNIIHRDIKPNNFAMGVGRHWNRLFLFDFGLAKEFRDPNTGKHIDYRDGKPLAGTARYASINAHNGIEQSCRDDMEAIGYVIMYFLRGQLPWQGLAATNNQQKCEKIAEMKSATPAEVLCKGYPSEFLAYVNYCRQLPFDGTPDYSYLRQLFRTLLRKLKYQENSAVRPPESSSSFIGTYLESTHEGSKRFDDIFYNNIKYSNPTGPEISEVLRKEMSYYADQLATIQMSPTDVYEKAVLNLEEARLSNVVFAIEKAKNEVIEVVRSERRTYLESVIITYSNDFDHVNAAVVQLKLKEFDNRLTDLKIPLSDDLWVDHTPGLNSTCLSPYPTTEALLKM